MARNAPHHTIVPVLAAARSSRTAASCAWLEVEVERRHELLVRDVNHRTKNAMAMAASLLRVHADRSDDPGTGEALLTAAPWSWCARSRGRWS
jgi:two-component sensor histidine kinase